VHLALPSRLLPIERSHPVIFGIVNVTPDSFSDGGRFVTSDDAADHGERLLDEGADVLDIGGESTRPQGARPVEAAEEIRRILPVVKELKRRRPDCLLSVDTVKAEVAAAALGEGAEIVNDVSGLRLDPTMSAVVASARAGLVLMHSRGTVSTMATYELASYGNDVTGEVIGELCEAVERATGAGVARTSIVLDPGFGFSKRSDHSMALLAELPRVVALGFPVLVGVSRKRFVGELSGELLPAERLPGTLAVNVMALERGAHIFRVHDVRAHRQALDLAQAIVRRSEG
jgi:dihydropteroate synthase